MWHSADGMGWWMLWGGIMMILFWGLIVALVVWGVQSLTRRQSEGEGSQQAAGQRAPLDIAKERYATGEIDGEHFDEILSRLEGS
jgi:putative membrane protein